MTFYPAEKIRQAIGANRRGELGHYGLVDAWLRAALSRHPVKDQKVLVIGSCEQGYGPWYEAMLWSVGCRNITVTDYNEIRYEDWSVKFSRTASLTHYDAILSISTFEHSGLGRYGDDIDPDGDLKAMAATRELLNPGGKLFLSVPIGKDKVVENLHRYYGIERLPTLLDGWKVIDTEGFNPQRLWVDADWDPSRKEGFPEYGPILVCQPEAE